MGIVVIIEQMNLLEHITAKEMELAEMQLTTVLLMVKVLQRVVQVLHQLAELDVQEQLDQLVILQESMAVAHVINAIQLVIAYLYQLVGVVEVRMDAAAQLRDVTVVHAELVAAVS